MQTQEAVAIPSRTQRGLQRMRYSGQVEHADARPFRERNTRVYRLAHWPLWISVFFLAPGPLVFQLFARGPGRAHLGWLAAVLAGTGAAGLRGQLPGVEPRPYILRFDEDKPNPLYRRICYSFAWSAAVSFALMNLLGLADASLTGCWRLRQIYRYGYFPVAGTVLLLGALGRLPRVGASTKGEGVERRYFYGTVWSVTAAQILLLVLWKTLPVRRATSVGKLLAFGGALALLGLAASRGMLPRTRPILPDEAIVAD